MSHFVKCDRCNTQDAVMGSISLPPGWQKIYAADLCEPCCRLIYEFIHLKPGDAAALPVEPTPQVSDKLFETAPEEKREETNPSATPTAENSEARGQGEPAQGAKITQTLGAAPVEASTEERVRTRKTKKRMQGQAAILPDKRTSFPHGSNVTE